jgi:diaminopropionate ammonia-lyase
MRRVTRPSPDLADSLRDFYENPERATPRPASRDERRAGFHRSMPGYSESSLVEAPRTAAALGLDRLLVKVEAERLGLPSFKILGASWAVCRALSARAGRDEPAATLDELRALASTLGPLTLVAATDGNHGRAVARMAKLLSLEAHILVPAGTAQARIAAIEGEVARVDVVDGSYDDAVARSAALADDRHLVISDTSWPGYEEVPRWVIDGYGTIFDELGRQTESMPDLCVVQLGVGALAAATVSNLAADNRVILGVEPADAACVLAALRDGEGATVPGPHRSLMAGLNCGVASPIALPDLRAGLDSVAAIDDSATIAAVRLLFKDGIEAGETGAAGVAGLVALHERLGLGDHTAALTICTEGPTDPDSFARITAG